MTGYCSLGYMLLLQVLSLLGVFHSPLWFTGHLFMTMERSVMLHTFFTYSLMRNSWALLLTVQLTLITVYIFVVIGYVFHHQDFVGSPSEEGICDTLAHCFAVGLFSGLRAGGGLGDLLPHRTTGWRLMFDFAFYLLAVLVILNIVYGIIIDTFAQLREEHNAVEQDNRSFCLICGQEAAVFDRQVEGGFAQHTDQVHNIWQYLFFLIYLKQKSEDEFTGQESYVSAKLKLKDVSFFPLRRSMDLTQVPQHLQTGAAAPTKAGAVVATSGSASSPTKLATGVSKFRDIVMQARQAAAKEAEEQEAAKPPTPVEQDSSMIYVAAACILSRYLLWSVPGRTLSTPVHSPTAQPPNRLTAVE